MFVEIGGQFFNTDKIVRISVVRNENKGNTNVLIKMDNGDICQIDYAYNHYEMVWDDISNKLKSLEK